MSTGSGLDALARACEERGMLFDCVPVVLAGGGYQVLVWHPHHDEPLVDVTEIDALTAGRSAFEQLSGVSSVDG